MDNSRTEKKKKKSKKEKAPDEKEHNEVREKKVISEKIKESASEHTAEANLDGANVEKKKKKKKNKHSTPENTTEAEVVSEKADIGTDKKKKRKEKASDDNTSHQVSRKKSRSSEVNGVALSSAAVVSGNYVEHPDVTRLSSSVVDNLRQEMDMVVLPESAGETYKPLTTFSQLYPSLGHYCPEVQRYIESKGFTKPSPIQSQCWPILLSNKDAIGIAATGSGKTLAFLIPALLSISKSRMNSVRKHGGVPSPKMLVLAPTRELAMQSQNVVDEIGSVRGVCVYGGVPKPAQKTQLRAGGGVDVVVATPGRLEDLISENALSLSGVQYLVLDEADRMLDDGFEPAIRRIVGCCPSSAQGRQTVMFSATWPEEIRELADTFLKKDAVRVTVGGDELSANHRVTQIVECIDGRNKDRRLLELLGQYHKSRKNRCLIFVLYKREAVTLQTTLVNRGFNVTAIHGDKGQGDRTAALEEFKSGRIPLLIATDVAARGLDIPQVEYVLNYSFPLTVEDYVHRIGRTGRGGASGISHTFFTDFDKSMAGALVAVLQDANQEVPQEIYKYPMVTKKKSSKLYGDFGPKADLAGKKATKITFDN